ncbi:MAG: hypothetical protein IT462_12595 [Planctomycetes bacterium]|nr:hypothetical protein [Planctomycetota bacterium]
MTIDPATLKQFLLDLQAQDDCYGRMLNMTRAQVEKLGVTADAAEIGSMLAEKQTLMAELEVLGARLAPVKQQWPQLRGELAPSIVEFADKRLAALQASLKKLIEAEDQASSLIQERLLGNRDKLAGLTRKTAAGRAYNAATVSAKFIDVK